MTDHVQKQKNDPSHRISSILHRRKMMVMGIFLLLFSTCALLIQSLKPVYVAHAQIAFDDQDETFIKTQQHRIKSLATGRQVVAGLNLFDDENFGAKGSVNPPQFKSLNVHNTSNNGISDGISKDHAVLIKSVLAPLAVTQEPNSNILKLSYAHHNPDRASQILSAFIRHYVADQNIEDIYRQPAQSYGAQWQDSLLLSLSEAHNVLEDIKTKQTQRIGTIAKNQIDVKYKRAQETVLDLKNQLSPFLGENDTLKLTPSASVLRNSPDIQALRQDEKALKRKLEKLSLRYGDAHPKIINTKLELAQIERDIHEESHAIMLDLKIKHDHATAHLQELSAQRKKAETSELAHNDTQFDHLENALMSVEDLLAQIESASGPGVPMHVRQSSNIHVISPATPPLLPVFPNRIKLTGLSLTLSIILAMLIVILIEKNRKTFLNGGQLESTTDHACFALIPNVKGDKGKAMADYVLDHPSSDVAEAVRNLALNIKLSAKKTTRKTGQVMMLTSSKPNEGKTTLCAWLARLSARSGMRVLLIDGDLRSPCLHTSLGRKNTLSLVDYLSGAHKLEEVIDTKDPSGLHAIYGRAVPNSALDLVSSKKMDKLILSLKNDYDLIIIDTPACMAVSDARAIQKNCDQLLYVVAWHRTRKEVVHSGLSQFEKFENLQISTVLTNVDVKKHVQFGFGEVVSDYGTYKPA